MIPAERTPQRSTLFLILILIAFVIAAVWYSVAIPVGEGVDEIPHFAYVDYVKTQWRLPVQPWRDNGRTLDVVMGHHPPLYYALGALVSFWTDTSDFSEVLRPNPHFVWAENDPTNGWNVYLHSPEEAFPYKGTILAIQYLRLWSVVLGTVTLFAVYRAGRLLLPKHPWIPVLAVALFAFNPSFIFMSSTVHHDPLMATLYALSFWWMVRALSLDRALTLGDTIVGGLLLGAGLLTKLSGLSLLALFGLTLLFKARQQYEWRQLVRDGIPLYGVAMVIAGWWYLRNQLLYDDPLGWQMFLATHSHMVRQGSYSWFIFRKEFLGQIDRTFWGGFGYMHITLPEPVRRPPWLLMGIGVVGAAWAGVRRRQHLLDDWRRHAWIVLLAGMLLVFISFVRFSVATTGAGHGRYLFTLAAPLALAIAVGLNQVVGFRAPRILAILVGAGLLAYAVFVPIRFVLPKYAAPKTVQPVELEEARESSIVYGDALELVAYKWSRAAVPPGQPVSLALYWRAVGESRPDLYVHLRLRDRFGTAFVEQEFWPAPGTTTAVWNTNTIYVTRRELYIPPNAAPGTASLELVVQPGRAGDPLPAQQAGGEALSTAPRIGEILVGQVSTAEEDELSPQIRHAAQLGEHIVLLGHDLTERQVAAGGTVEVTLYWKTQASLNANYTAFVHIVNGSGQLVAQQDNEPNNGQYPTSAWEPDAVVRDPYAIRLPGNLPPGEYTIYAGMYEWPSLERLPVRADGEVVGDAVTLESLTVVEQ